MEVSERLFSNAVFCGCRIDLYLDRLMCRETLRRVSTRLLFTVAPLEKSSDLIGWRGGGRSYGGFAPVTLWVVNATLLAAIEEKSARPETSFFIQA